MSRPLDAPVAYRVNTFDKDTCARIRDRWDEIRRATRAAVDAANAFGIDEDTLTSANALIPIAYYVQQHPRLNLRGPSEADVRNARRVRVWLLAALLNGVFGGSSDSMLTRLREVLQVHRKPNCDFPIAQLDDAVRAAGRISSSSQDAVESVLILPIVILNVFLPFRCYTTRGTGAQFNFGLTTCFREIVLNGACRNNRGSYVTISLISAS